MTSIATKLDTLDARRMLAAELMMPPGLELVEANHGQKLFASHGAEEDLYGDAVSSVAALDHMTLLGSGDTRRGYTWSDSNAVVKVPTDLVGAGMNRLEVAYYEQAAYHGYPVVPCRLLWLPNGLPVVLMEKVEILDAYDRRKPVWSENIDSGQTAQSALLGGDWAVYDAGYPPLARVSGNYFDYVATYAQEYDRLVSDTAPA